MAHRGTITSQLPRQDSMTLSSVTFTLVVTLTLTLTLQSVVADTDNCQRLPVRERIVKELTLPHRGQNMEVSCTADVDLYKCEGQCESSVLPTVRRRRGFLKNCRCCKEGDIQTRAVTLTSCYHNGDLIRDLATTIDVTEILSCHCSPCTN